MCGCWRPAGSRWPWPGRPGTGWRRCLCLNRMIGLIPADPRRWRCSRTGPAGWMRVSSWIARPGRRGTAGGPAGWDAAGDRAGCGAGGRRWGSPSCWIGLMTGSVPLAGGFRLAAGRHRSLAATVQWSYQWLMSRSGGRSAQYRVFPGQVDAGGRRGGGGLGGIPAAVLRLVDCSMSAALAHRSRWPGPVCDAGDAARLRGRFRAGRGRGAGRSRRRAGRVGASGGGGGCCGAADWHRGAGRGPAAGCRGRHHARGAVLGHGPRRGGRAAAGGRAGAVVAAAGPGAWRVPAAARGSRARRAGQRRVVRRALLARRDRVLRT